MYSVIILHHSHIRGPMDASYDSHHFVQIQNIMVDPVMQQVLKECQETPGALSNHLRDPGIASKLQKLMGAGIIRMS